MNIRTLICCYDTPTAGISGADFGMPNKKQVQEWSSIVARLHKIGSNIGGLLADRQERYHLIHLSHAIEHIPKYSLLHVVDALYLL